MAYNLLIARQGGTLHLDEMLPERPASALLTLTEVDRVASSTAPFPAVTDAVCTVDDFIAELPARISPWKTIAPTTNSGTVGDLTDKRRRLLLNRGGRRLYLVPNEVDTEPGDVVSLLRFDEGVDCTVKDGDLLCGVRCSYEVSLTGIEFVGRIQAYWTVTGVSGTVYRFTHVYDSMRQEVGQPASWQDVLDLRPDADNELSQFASKEVFVRKAWDDICTQLRTYGVLHNLVIPNGSTALRDAVVYQTISNLFLFQNLAIPETFIGQGDDYQMHLERKIASYLSTFYMPVDYNQDGTFEESKEEKPVKQHWFRGRRSGRS